MEPSFKPFDFGRADVVLVVPPDASIKQPSLACHLLQACAAERGFEVKVVYANIMFAAIIGELKYSKLLNLSFKHWLVERGFGIQAFQMPPFSETDRERLASIGLVDLEEKMSMWLDWVETTIRGIGPKIVGCTSSYEQIASSFAILNRCKTIDPGMTTIIGGANCEDEMAQGILSLRGQIDHVASGESESSFPEFLDQVLRQGIQPETIVRGKPCNDLDSLPFPDYGEFFEQYRHFIPDSEHEKSGQLGVPFETSRGCWWGQKHHCTFCGLNGLGMGFREKSAGKALEGFVHLSQTYPVRKINTVDNIMPHGYFQNLLPAMAETMREDLVIFYEQKANIPLRKALALKNARILSIQPGIESLDSDLLRLMDKGVKAYQNIELLRVCRSLGIQVGWNLLSGLPHEKLASYQAMVAMVPYLSHLEPPSGVSVMRIDRFSPYFNAPERFGIENLRPKPSYAYAFPDHADFAKLAYHFDGDFRDESPEYLETIETLRTMVHNWRVAWAGEARRRPVLRIHCLFGDSFMLEDKRGIPDRDPYHFLTAAQVSVLLNGGSLARKRELDWALDKQWLLEVDGRLIPLATSDSETLIRFDRGNRDAAIETDHAEYAGSVG